MELVIFGRICVLATVITYKTKYKSVQPQINGSKFLLINELTGNNLKFKLFSILYISRIFKSLWETAAWQEIMFAKAMLI